MSSHPVLAKAMTIAEATAEKSTIKGTKVRIDIEQVRTTFTCMAETLTRREMTMEEACTRGPTKTGLTVISEKTTDRMGTPTKVDTAKDTVMGMLAREADTGTPIREAVMPHATNQGARAEADTTSEAG